MPINTDKSHRVQVTLTIEEYDLVKADVKRLRKSGLKMTESKYVAKALRWYWQHKAIEGLFNGNGST